MKTFVRLAWLILFLLILPVFGYSQGSGYTPVTGTYAPYANGSVQADYINQSGLSQLPLLNGSTFPLHGATNFDSSGNLSLFLADNALIQPNPSQWQITACQKGGSQPKCCVVTKTVTGSAPMSITTDLATCPYIPPSGSGCAPVGSNLQILFNSDGSCGSAQITTDLLTHSKLFVPTELDVGQGSGLAGLVDLSGNAGGIVKSPNTQTGGNPAYDVTYANAKVDGVTDDLANFNIALSTASSLNASVRIADGMMFLSGPPTIPSGTAIQCMPGAGIRFPSTGTIAQGILIAALQNVSLKGCKIDGGTSVKNHISVTAGSQFVNISDNVFLNGQTGPVGSLSQINLNGVKDVTIERNQMLGGMGTYNLVMNGSAGSWLGTGQAYSPNYRVRVKNNTITSGGPIQIAIAGFACRYCEFTGNFIDEGNGITLPASCCGYGILSYSYIAAVIDALPPPASISGSTGTITVTMPTPSSGPIPSFWPEINDQFPILFTGTTGGTATNGAYLATVTGINTATFQAPAGSNFTGVSFATPVPITGLTCAATLCTVTVAAGVLPPVASATSLIPAAAWGGTVFATTLSGVTGWTGNTPNKVITEAIILSPTTFEYACSGCGTGTLTSAVITPTLTANLFNTNVVIANNDIRNTAGNAIYSQSGNNTTIANNVISNTMQQLPPGALLEGGISVNGGDKVAVTGNVIENSGQSGYDFENTRQSSLAGGSISGFTHIGLKVGGSSTGFDLGHGLTIANGLFGIYIPQGLAPAFSGKIDGITLQNLTGNAVVCGIGTGTVPSDIDFVSITGSLATTTQGVIDNCLHSTYTAIKMTGGWYEYRGVNTVTNGLKCVGLPANACLVASNTTSFKSTDFTGDISLQGVSLIGQNTDVVLNNTKFTNLTGTALSDGSPAPATGNLASGVGTITNLSTCGGIVPGVVVTDGTTAANLPGKTVVTSTCSGSPGTVSISNPAAASASGDTLNFYTNVTTGIKIQKFEASATGAAVSQCMLLRGVQGLDAEGVSCTGYSAVSDFSLDFRGVAGNLVPNVIKNATIIGQNIPLSVTEGANNLTAAYNNFSGNALYGIQDATTNLGLVYRANDVTNNGAGYGINVSNVNSFPIANLSGFSSSAPIAGRCTSGTQRNEYDQIGVGVFDCDPVSVTWIKRNYGGPTTVTATSPLTVNGGPGPASGALTIACTGCGSGSGGTVTTFSSSNLAPLFTTSVATPGTTPAQTFSQSTAAANTVFGNFTAGVAVPAFSAAPIFSAANLTNFPLFNQNTTGTSGGLSANITESQVTNLTTDLAARAPLVSPALTGTPTVPTAAAGTSTTQAASTTFALLYTAAPLWAQYLGNGTDGANITASGNLSGVKYYTNFTIPFGNTVTVNANTGLTIHATGTCTIAGSLNARGVDVAAAGTGLGGGGGGGSGGGAAAGTAGVGTFLVPSPVGGGPVIAAGGTAGVLSGGVGGTGAAPSSNSQRIMQATGGSTDGQYLSGGAGKAGGSSGGALGNSGMSVTLICATVTGTDGTHTGSIAVDGQAGGAAPGNSTGGGSGGGGGVIILSSQAPIATPPTMTVTGGAGGTCGAFTTCGAGGTGGAGWTAIFQGW